VALHRLASITIGVPNVEDTCVYYSEFGLIRDGETFSTRDGGEQLRIVDSPYRRLFEFCVGADDTDDLERVTERLNRLGVSVTHEAACVSAVDIHSGARVVVRVLPRSAPRPVSTASPSDSHIVEQQNDRAVAVLREESIHPRKLGHVVLGTPNAEASRRFFVDGVGLKVSDEVRGAAIFLRCSTDHHNLLLQTSAVPFLHHTAWQVDDVDEVGRGATCMLKGHPERHVWGLGRHFIGSNFFWYLRDPAGNFSEYYSDMDDITDGEIWTPGSWEPTLRALYAWGPDIPPSMLEPEDLAHLMAFHPN